MIKTMTENQIRKYGKKGFDLKMNFGASTLACTLLMYMEVMGQLTDTAYFYGFLFLFTLASFIMTLFKAAQD